MSVEPSRARPGQLTAMISSTGLDLEKQRPAVEEACLAAGVFPIWMKHLPAREALPLSEAVQSQELIANNNRCLAEALVRQSKAAEAFPHARHAVEIYSRPGSPNHAEAQAILAECEGGGAVE